MMKRSSRRDPAYPHPGNSTAMPLNVQYRLGKLKSLGLLHGVWLDYGCANGGYTEALVQWGARRAIGVDVDPSHIAEANCARKSDATEYSTCSGFRLPFPDASFEGVLLNEVLEHVADEAVTLNEIRRVLRPSGLLVVMSPNRWFPFEGHGMRIGSRDFGFPVPFLPWLPRRLATRVMTARNYWPHELRDVVGDAGFDIVSVDYVLPVLEMYRWLPASVTRWYQRNLIRLDKTPLRKFGVSTLILARPAAA